MPALAAEQAGAKVADFTLANGLELVVIDAETRLRDFKQMLRNNEVYYALRSGLVC